MDEMAKRPELPTGYFWRGTVIWCRTDPVTRKQASTGLKDPKRVRVWERERESKADDPQYLASLGATLGEWVKETIRMKSTDKSEATVSIYQRKLGHFVKMWGADLPLDKIDPERCDAYRAARNKAGVSDHTVVKEFSALSQLLKAARRRGKYRGDIAALRPLDLAPKYVPRKRHLTWPEVEALMSECGPKLGAIVAVAVSVGARLSEALKFGPADLDDWVAHLRGTKTEGSDRYVPVLPQFRPLLTSVLERLPVGDCPNNLRRDLAKACRRAGIAICTPNDLRRSHASLLIADGVHKEVVRRLLGHKTSRMVEMVYGQIEPKELERLAEEQGSSRRLLPPSATESATVDGEIADPGANSEGRTPDLRFTKPSASTGETSDSAECKPNGDYSTHGETPRETRETATVRATVALEALRELVEAFDLAVVFGLDGTTRRLEDAVEAARHLLSAAQRAKKAGG